MACINSVEGIVIACRDAARIARLAAESAGDAVLEEQLVRLGAAEGGEANVSEPPMGAQVLLRPLSTGEPAEC